MTLAYRSVRTRCFAFASVWAAIAAALAGCASHAGSPAGTGGVSSGTGGSVSSSSGGGTVSSSSSSAASSSSGSSGSVDACAAGSGALAWTAEIPSVPGGLTLVDLGAGPTGDVVVADRAGGATFEQHRWSSKGASLSTHQDQAGTYTGPMFTSGIFVDQGNDVFYGTLLTGPQGTSTAVKLSWNRVDPTGTVAFSQSTKGTLPTSGGAPGVVVFQVGGDATTNLHGAFLMTKPQYVGDGVYCYGYDGSNQGASAQNVVNILTSKDFLWPSADNDLVLWKGLTTTTNLGCSAPLTVPAAGGVALAKLTGAGACLWNKLLALPTAAVEASSFRLGADGSMLAAVVFSGTVDFGGGPLTSTGKSSLALARFDSAGALLWAKRYGGAGSSFTLGSVGANATGSIVLTAGYAGAVDLGGGPLPAGHDTFLAVIEPGGQLAWAKTISVGAQGSLMAAVGKCGVVLATSSPTVDLGTGPLATVQDGVASIGVAALGL